MRCADCKRVVFPALDSRGQVFPGMAQCSLHDSLEDRARYMSPTWPACPAIALASEPDRVRTWTLAICSSQLKVMRQSLLAESPEELREQIRGAVLATFAGQVAHVG